MSGNNGWIGVDLDGTLAFYDRWEGELFIGDPIPEMVTKVQQRIEDGFEVRIFTARVADDGSPRSRNVEEVREAIRDWCEEHIGHRLPVTNAKDMNMIELWDDRAVMVIRNTGRFAYEGVLGEVEELTRLATEMMG